MTDTVIYLSITHGNETLIVDGNLYLFQELLVTLQDPGQDLNQHRHALVFTTPVSDSKQEGSHVTR